MRVSALVVLLSLPLGGCANFQAVSDFAGETGQLTQTVKSEFAALDTQCLRQAEIVVVANRIADDGPVKDCRRHKAAQGGLADLTVAVLDDYARALAALADDKSFALSKEVKAVGKQVDALKSRDGERLAGKKETTALVSIAEVLASVAASREREATVRRLAEEHDNLALCAAVLRAYFVAPPGTPGPAPYANLAGLARSEIDSTLALLRGPALRGAEPIRAHELARELEALRRANARRVSGGVPQAMAAAIDAWLLALDRFVVEARSRDPRLLYQRLSALHDKLAAVDDALQAIEP